MLSLTLMLLGGVASGFAYTAGGGYANARPDQNVFSTPSPVEYLGRVTKVRASYETGMALRIDGSVYTWGDNSNWVLGQSKHLGQSSYPLRVQGISPCVDISVSPG